MEVFFASGIEAFFATGVEVFFAIGVEVFFASGIEAFFATGIVVGVQLGSSSIHQIDMKKGSIFLHREPAKHELLILCFLSILYRNSKCSHLLRSRWLGSTVVVYAG